MPDVSHVFDRVAETYGGYDDSPVGQRIRALVRARAGALLSPGAQIADVGCGPGTLTNQLADDGFAAVGLDQSPGMLETAGRGGHARFVRHDLAAGPLPDGPYDAVVAAMGPLNYTADPGPMWAHLRASVRPGAIAWLALARGAGARAAARHPARLWRPLVTDRALRLDARVAGAPLSVFVWDPQVALQRFGRGWRLTELRGLGHTRRIPAGWRARTERAPGLRRVGAVSFLELRAV